MKMNFIFIFGGETMQYNTKQKNYITAILRNADGTHKTAEEITRELAEQGVSVGKATVYRQLERLTEQGVVRKFFVQEGSACYQYVGDHGDCRNHYHFKCAVCGKLLHLECDFMDKVSAHVFEHHGFTISNEKTVLYGICAECRKAQK